MWEEFIEATKTIQRLDYTWRYSTIPIVFPENVATHSYAVVAYSALIHRQLHPDDMLTLSYILLTATVHDIAESHCSDIVRTFKYRTKNLKNAIDEAEEIVIEEDFPSTLRDLYKLAQTTPQDKRDYVKAVVKTADFVSLYNLMRREFLRGNREITPFYLRMIEDLKMAGANQRKASFPEADALADLYTYLHEKSQELFNQSQCKMILNI
jgi:5'-deoxynucleotidase YfbR-like HD superfamily hydrolase